MPRRCCFILLALGLSATGSACTPDPTSVGEPTATTAGTSTGTTGSGGPTSGPADSTGTTGPGDGSSDSDGASTGTTGTTGPQGEWAEGWDYRKRIVIHPSSDLSEFPVALLFDQDPDLVANAAADGSDLMVTDQSGLGMLPYELEFYALGSAALWVDAGSLSATQDTVVYLYYGNPAPPAPPPAAQTWPDRFEGVWHMTIDGSALVDSVDPPHPATASAMATTATSQRGISGTAAEFDGIDDLHSAGDPPDDSLDAGMDSFTVSLWTQVGTPAGTFDTPLYKGAAENNDPGYGFFFGTSNWVSCISDGAPMPQHLLLVPQGAADQEWHHHLLTVDRDLGTVTAYLDGTLAVTLPLESGSLDSQDALTFSNPASPFAGRLDEVRIQRAAVGADRARAEWQNLGDPAAFYTVGPEQAAP